MSFKDSEKKIEKTFFNQKIFFSKFIEIRDRIWARPPSCLLGRYSLLLCHLSKILTLFCTIPTHSLSFHNSSLKCKRDSYLLSNLLQVVIFIVLQRDYLIARSIYLKISCELSGKWKEQRKPGLEIILHYAWITLAS